MQQGRLVVFTGTPCQATAIHNIVMQMENGKYRNQLITLAVICHGVASPMAWESYKKWNENKAGSKLVKANFRDKSKKGYRKSYCRYEYESGAVTYLLSSKYIEATLVYNLALRNSCFHCDCKGINDAVDIIAGDWFTECTGKGKLGTSCIVAFTERGRIYVENNLTNLRKWVYTDVVKKNSLIEDSINQALNRKQFLENIKDWHYWDRVEELYPPKYKIKKILTKMGLYDRIRKIYVAARQITSVIIEHLNL